MPQARCSVYNTKYFGITQFSCNLFHSLHRTVDEVAQSHLAIWFLHNYLRIHLFSWFLGFTNSTKFFNAVKFLLDSLFLSDWRVFCEVDVPLELRFINLNSISTLQTSNTIKHIFILLDILIIVIGHGSSPLVSTELTLLTKFNSWQVWTPITGGFSYKIHIECRFTHHWYLVASIRHDSGFRLAHFLTCQFTVQGIRQNIALAPVSNFILTRSLLITKLCIQSF